jgi:hypothetical protein
MLIQPKLVLIGPPAVVGILNHALSVNDCAAVNWNPGTLLPQVIWLVEPLNTAPPSIFPVVGATSVIVPLFAFAV